MDNIRNLHTFSPNGYGDPVLSSIDPVGSVDTAAAEHWGLYQGDPAALISGDMALWGTEPSQVTDTGCQIWHDANDGQWYKNKVVQVGLVYDGPDIGAVSVDIFTGYGSDGYYRIGVTYPSKSPAPRVVWVVGATYTPPQQPDPFWTRFIGSHEIAGHAATAPPSTFVVFPYSATLGAIAVGAVQWFKVTLSAGTYRFHTVDSPYPFAFDTVLALFSASGALIAQSDNVAPEDYRSSVTETLSEGTYYIGVTGFAYGVPASGGFSMPASIDNVPSGTVFKIEAA